MHVTLALAISALFAMAQDKAPEKVQEKDNPQFKYWADWKVGAWVKLKSETEAGGQKFEGENTMKLVEKADDKVVLEISSKMKINGQEMAMPVQKQEVKAREPADKYKIDQEGEEEIDVAGKKLKCKWAVLTVTMGQPDKKMSMKFWMSKEIPGGIAKSDMVGDAGGAKVKMAALEWGEK